MGGVSAEEHPLVAAIRELEQRDAELAARIDELTHLEAEIASLRAEAERVQAFAAALPSLRERAASDVREAQAELARRIGIVCGAEVQLGSADDRAAAERTLATAETARADAEARLARVKAEAERIEHETAAVDQNAASLADRAGTLARRVDGDLADGIEQWAARARAAVFAQRTHAEGERLQLQTEASELASSVTGEPVVGDVALARRASERALAARHQLKHAGNP